MTKFANKKENTKAPKLASRGKSAKRCRYQTSDDRHCGMPRWRKHRSYCIFHARQEQQLIDADKLGKELDSFTGEFRTNADLNRALGNLFKAVSQNRIPPRNAAVLGYLGQLLMQNIHRLHGEIEQVDGRKAVNRAIMDTLDASDQERGVEEDGADQQRAAEEKRAAEAHAEKLKTHTFYPNGAGGFWVPNPQPDAPPDAPRGEIEWVNK